MLTSATYHPFVLMAKVRNLFQRGFVKNFKHEITVFYKKEVSVVY